MIKGKVEILQPLKESRNVSRLESIGLNPEEAIEAVKAIADAVVEHRRIKQDNMTAREAIRAQSAVMRKQIAANRKSLARYIDGTFDDRNVALHGLLEALDECVKSGNVELAKVMADQIAGIVKSGPLIQAAELNQQMKPDGLVFRIGKST
jgi:hypothetical protein